LRVFVSTTSTLLRLRAPVHISVGLLPRPNVAIVRLLRLIWTVLVWANVSPRRSRIVVSSFASAHGAGQGAQGGRGAAAVGVVVAVGRDVERAGRWRRRRSR
jgi:hypothetical protein